MLLSEMRDICLRNEICPKKIRRGQGKMWNIANEIEENLKLSHTNLSQTNTEKEELRTKDLFPKRSQGKDVHREKGVCGIINAAEVRNDGNQYNPARLDTFQFAFHFLCGKLRVWKSSFPQAVFSGHSSREPGPALPSAGLCSDQGTKSSREPLALTPESGPAKVLAPTQSSTMGTYLREVDIFRLRSSLALPVCQSKPLANSRPT